jgi:hypothetical protein
MNATRLLNVPFESRRAKKDRAAAEAAGLEQRAKKDRLPVSDV